LSTPTDSLAAEQPVQPIHPRKERGTLLQILGVGFGIAVAVGNTISAGIVRTPGDIAARLPDIRLFFLVWFGGALYALLSAFQLAELGAAIPKSGGQYNYSRRAIGDFAAFVVGWSDWLSTSGTTGLVGIVIGEYMAYLFPVFDGFYKIKITAVSVILLFALLQWRSISMGSKVQNFTTVLKGLAFFIIVVACFTFGGHHRLAAEAAPLAQAAAPIAIPVGAALITALLLGMQATIYTYDGWDGVIYFGDEIKNPGHLVPRAIFASLFSVVLIYLLVNAAVLYVLPMNEIAGNNFSVGLAAQRVFGPHGDFIFRSIMVIALFSSLNALHLMGARVIYAMSRDGLFFRTVSRVNKGGTPTVGLLPGYACVLLRYELHALLYLHVHPSRARTGPASTLSCLGLPLDHRAGPARFHRLPPRSHPRRPRQQRPNPLRPRLLLPRLPPPQVCRAPRARRIPVAATFRWPSPARFNKKRGGFSSAPLDFLISVF
jgi:basic amino acid/polyamine antiporter, APA family